MEKEQQKEPMTFVQGMSFKEVSPNAPESVRGGISFKYPEIVHFIEQHKNKDGYVNIKMMKSLQKGSIYFILDTWKPKEKEVVDNETGEVVPDVNSIRTLSEEQKANMTVEEVADMSDIPF
jgi:hypothetical protein